MSLTSPLGLVKTESFSKFLRGAVSLGSDYFRRLKNILELRHAYCLHRIPTSGNKTGFSQNIGGQQLAINNLTLPNVDPATNRFTANQGYSYDKNGNIINDPASSGRSFTFNGDNKQTEVKDANGLTIGRYFYDGEGRRVKKVTDLETTVFVYSSGKLIAEYSTATPPANPTTNYTATDQLGSPRVLTDALGNAVSRRDFLPFGEELYADGQNRKTGDKYSVTGQDAVRQRFTGYQKDIETGLDFAEARYYNNQHGRFTAVDPLLASGKSTNPQTFNRYVYVMNRPLSLTDSKGLQAGQVIRGRTYYNKDTDIYQTGPGKGFTRYDGPNKTFVNRSGNSIEMRRNGWTDFGKVASIVGPDPVKNPNDYELMQVEKAFSAAANDLRQDVYDLSPDYAKLQFSVPMIFNVELSMSKDLRFYAGGGMSRGGFNDFLKQASNFNFVNPTKPVGLGFKPLPSFSLGYFMSGVDSERTRNDAMTGTNVSGVVPLVLIPASIGLSKSIPDNGAPFLTSPTAIEIGTPNGGAGVSQSVEVLTGFSDSLRRRFDREPIPR